MLVESNDRVRLIHEGERVILSRIRSLKRPIPTTGSSFCCLAAGTVATNHMACATIFKREAGAASRCSRPVTRRDGFPLASARFNSRATHIHCCPHQPCKLFGRGSFCPSQWTPVPSKNDRCSEFKKRDWFRLHYLIAPDAQALGERPPSFGKQTKSSIAFAHPTRLLSEP